MLKHCYSLPLEPLFDTFNYSLESLFVNCDRKCYRPSIGYYNNLIRQDKFFYFVKFNHGFWDCLHLRKEGKQIAYQRNHGDEVIDEVLHCIKNIKSQDNRIIFAVSPYGSSTILRHRRAKDRLGQMMLQGKKGLEEAAQYIRSIINRSNQIDEILPKDYIPHHALVWKNAMQRRRLYRFFELINQRKVILFGLSHFSKMVKYKFEHYELNMKSNWDRHDILKDIRDLYKKHKNHRPVFLFQAGDILSAWFMFNFAKEKPDCFMIDMGRAADILVPPGENILNAADKKHMPNLDIVYLERRTHLRNLGLI